MKNGFIIIGGTPVPPCPLPVLAGNPGSPAIIIGKKMR